MDIASAKYFQANGSDNNQVRVTTDESEVFWVPMDNANTDYKEILAWVDAGNTIEAAD
jgi:hypothetical protein|tara:strand:+ start:581 stop:754 length:174 start_codon:yes stop_codon:yes gene_type:complete